MTDLPAQQTDSGFLPTRNSLLSRLKHWEDAGSWREFFDTYWKFLYSLALKSGLSDEDARDVVQETVVCVAKALRDGRFKRAQGGSFKAWLQVIVQRRVADYLRTQRLPIEPSARGPKGSERTPTVERLPAPQAEMIGELWEEEWSRNLTDAAIQRVKQRVSPKQFQMFDLYVLKEWPVTEIARTLHTNAARVYLAKHRVSSMIKQETAKLRRDWGSEHD